MFWWVRWLLDIIDLAPYRLTVSSSSTPDTSACMAPLVAVVCNSPLNVLPHSIMHGHIFEVMVFQL